MAIATVDTLTLLNAWPRRMTVPIYHWNQVTGAGVNAPLSEPRSDAWVQIEREYVAEGLTTAIGLAIPHLGFYPRPVFLTKRIPLYGVRRYVGLKLGYGYVQAIGTRATTVLQTAAAVAYTPALPVDNQVLATITVTVPAGTDPDEIRVYFQEAGRPDGFIDSTEVTDDRWRIEPLKVAVNGTTATITGHRALFVQPSIWADPYLSPNYNASAKNKADTGDVADFVTAVDVYRVYPDLTNAVRFLSRQCDGAGFDTTLGSAWIENDRLGLVAIRPPCCSGCHNPFEFVDIDFYAGLPTVNGEVQRDLQTALIRLANTELPQEPTAWSDKRLEIWQKDAGIALFGGNQDRRIDNETPFGSLTGQVAAWRVVSRLALGGGGTH